MIRYIPYIIGLMAAYDFSLHIFDLLHVYKKTKIKHPLGLWILLDYLSKGNKLKREKIYQIFWNIYWGTATILMVIYLVNI